jgi:hypothetical protein
MAYDPDKGWKIEHGQVKYEHNGYTITWSENADKWSCSELGLEHASLTKLKTAINKVDADNRRLADGGVSVILLGNNDWDRPEPVSVVLLDGDKEKAWIVRTKEGGNLSYHKKDRQLVEINRLVLAGDPAVEAGMTKWREASAAAKAAEAAKKAAYAAIPRLSRALLTKLPEQAPPSAMD